MDVPESFTIAGILGRKHTTTVDNIAHWVDSTETHEVLGRLLVTLVRSGMLSLADACAVCNVTFVEPGETDHDAST